MSLLPFASGEGAAARRPSARGACVTMVSGYDAAFEEALGVKVVNVGARAESRGPAQGKVEVAVV